MLENHVPKHYPSARNAGWTFRQFARCVIISSITGFLSIFLYLSDVTAEPNLVWQIPILTLSYSLIFAPFIAIGMAVFGLPITNFFRPRSLRWWIGPAAVLWGASTGKLAFFLFMNLTIFGAPDFWSLDTLDAGLIFGAITGFVWWRIQRNAVMALKTPPPPVSQTHPPGG